MNKKLKILQAPCCCPGSPPLDERVAQALAARFKALSDPSRVAIVNRLAGADEVCVCDFTLRLQLSQPTVSHHLRVLREAGLVQVRTEAQRRVYALDPGPLAELDVWLAPYRRLWNERLDALGRHLDRTPTMEE